MSASANETLPSCPRCKAWPMALSGPLAPRLQEFSPVSMCEMHTRAGAHYWVYQRERRSALACGREALPDGPRVLDALRPSLMPFSIVGTSAAFGLPGTNQPPSN